MVDEEEEENGRGRDEGDDGWIAMAIAQQSQLKRPNDGTDPKKKTGL